MEREHLKESPTKDWHYDIGAIHFYCHIALGSLAKHIHEKEFSHFGIQSLPPLFSLLLETINLTACEGGIYLALLSWVFCWLGVWTPAEERASSGIETGDVSNGGRWWGWEVGKEDKLPSFQQDGIILMSIIHNRTEYGCSHFRGQRFDLVIASEVTGCRGCSEDPS